MTDELISVLSTVPIPEPWLERLRNISPRYQFSVLPASKPEEIPAETWQNTDVLFTFKTLPQIDTAPKIKWVQIYRSSMEHVLENPFLKSASIQNAGIQNEAVQFTTVSGANAPQVGEFILTGMLTLSHQIPEIITYHGKREWDVKRWRQFKTGELRGSTVGVIGYGSIGREVARLLQPFDVKILASKLDVMHPEDTGYTIEGKGDREGNLFHRLYPPQAIRYMLKDCDFVVVTVPLTGKTINLFSKEVFESLKAGSFLVSISDQRVIPFDTLSSAIQDKHLRGAVLDVFEDAPPAQDHALWKLPNVILTPRLAWRSPLDFDQAMMMFSENLRRYLEGMDLLNLYDPERGY
ncbi:MAG: D-2-hydroxyacid dehydrogenase [Chloroflexi bacterium]|nr:D-2-hydroxyacid dehydrogenase [Chloroflexota bacterium]